MEAAATLWQSGKIKGLIVSGDNREANYNEPLLMREALIKRGVPAQRIVCDYAGLRTLDSVVRAQRVFKLNHVVFISQKFQNERAAYIAHHHQFPFHGFNAQEVTGKFTLKTQIREYLARVKMMLDLHILNTGPKHLGKPETIPF